MDLDVSGFWYSQRVLKSVLNTKEQLCKYQVTIAISKELSKGESKKTMPFIISSKRIKSLQINLPEESENLYSENYRTLLKETREDLNIQN